MLDLHETLFVEQKKTLSPDRATQHGIVSTIAAFANTVGGWLLVGVHEGAVQDNSEARWARQDGVPLIDEVRNALLGTLDPLPAFEAKVVRLGDQIVGVVRVYESSDTPHVMVKTGAVWVRETAGKRDAQNPSPRQGGAAGERRYKVETIGSRRELLDLVDRGHAARRRAASLLQAPGPLVADLFELGGRIAPELARIVVRLVPLTPPAAFQGWCTSGEASGAVLRAAEAMSGTSDLDPHWPEPDPSGVAVAIPGARTGPHQSVLDGKKPWGVKVVVDDAGVVGASIELAHVTARHRFRWEAEQLAEAFIAPTISAPLSVLGESGFVGRARCQIDLLDLGQAIALAPAGPREARRHVSTTADIVVPANGRDAAENLAIRAGRAFARSAGLPAWHGSAA